MTIEANEIQATRGWLEQFVIGLNLCPFAAKPFREGRIHYALEVSVEPTQIAERLIDELERLQTSPEIETTLLIIPNALGDFDVYWDFVEVAESIIEQLGLTGAFQIASFHPNYWFEGVAPDGRRGERGGRAAPFSDGVEDLLVLVAGPGAVDVPRLWILPSTTNTIPSHCLR